MVPASEHHRRSLLICHRKSKHQPTIPTSKIQRDCLCGPMLMNTNKETTIHRGPEK
ncbi:hypothetical protein [Pasteuria penetrans]|uniref:hypothetical protein n=1 Tax=Pasteuria penetrans TaxID=86005 RepID=UPI00165B444B|nr:hypothetical protein [Pasteuria penetrans]